MFLAKCVEIYWHATAAPLTPLCLTLMACSYGEGTYLSTGVPHACVAAKNSHTCPSATGTASIYTHCLHLHTHLASTLLIRPYLSPAWPAHAHASSPRYACQGARASPVLATHNSHICHALCQRARPCPLHRLRPVRALLAPKRSWPEPFHGSSMRSDQTPRCEGTLCLPCTIGKFAAQV